jgi:hypothetical protein
MSKYVQIEFLIMYSCSQDLQVHLEVRLHHHLALGPRFDRRWWHNDNRAHLLLGLLVLELEPCLDLKGLRAIVGRKRTQVTC